MHPLNDVLENLSVEALTPAQLTHLQGYPRLGEFLTFTNSVRTIRDNRSWPREFNCFDAYCRHRFGLSAIAAEKVFKLQKMLEQISN